MRKDTHTGYKLECGAYTNENYESCFCVTGESVVKHCTTAAVVVAGERASNRGVQIKRFTAAAHLSARHREGDGEKLSLLDGETLERQPEMFDKAPEKRSLNRYTV